METAALTRGSIPPQLVSLALPLIFGNILQQLYNTIDAMVIGRFAGETAFAAIGVAGTVMNLFLFLLSGCCTGISVLFAQQYGSRDLAGFRQEGFLASVFGGLFTLVLSLAALLLLRPLLTLMQTPEDVARLAADYLVVIFGGLLATFFYNLCAAALRSVGDTRSALLALLAAMAANLALDLLFVARLGMGIAGAAWATVLAQLLSVALCLLYLARRYPQLLFRREDRRLDRGLLRRTVSYGAVSALHQSSLYIGKLLVQGAVNSMGTPMISAYTATTRIEGFANSFGDSGAQAVSVFTAQNTGAGEERRVREGFRTSFLMMLALGAVMSVLLYAAAPAAIALLATGAVAVGSLLYPLLPGKHLRGLLPGPGTGDRPRLRHYHPDLRPGHPLLRPDTPHGPVRRGPGHRPGLGAGGELPLPHVLAHPEPLIPPAQYQRGKRPPGLCLFQERGFSAFWTERPPGSRRAAVVWSYCP